MYIYELFFFRLKVSRLFCLVIMEKAQKCYIKTIFSPFYWSTITTHTSSHKPFLCFCIPKLLNWTRQKMISYSVPNSFEMQLINIIVMINYSIDTTNGTRDIRLSVHWRRSKPSSTRFAKKNIYLSLCILLWRRVRLA